MCNRTSHPILLGSLSLGALLCMSVCVLRLFPRVCEGLKSTRIAVGGAWGLGVQCGRIIGSVCGSFPRPLI